MSARPASTGAHEPPETRSDRLLDDMLLMSFAPSEGKMIRKCAWAVTVCLVAWATFARPQQSAAPANKWEEAIRKFEEAK
jgi:hypothetical protein